MKNIILFAIAYVMVIPMTPFTINAQTSDKQAPSKAPAVQRLYFDHRGHVDAVEGDTLVINDRTYKVLSTVTLLSLDQKPLAGINNLNAGDFIGFTVDDRRRIEAIYILNPPKKRQKKKP